MRQSARRRRLLQLDDTPESVAREIERGELSEVKVQKMKMPRREVALIYRRGRPLSRSAQAFIQLLEDRYDVKALPEE